MRYNEIKQSITEAPMNPSSFAKSIESGQDKGVKVGFEFEVCIPKKSIDEWKSGGQTGGYDPNSTAWIEGKTVKDLLEGFEKYGRRTWKDRIEDLFKNKTSVSQQLGTADIWKLYTEWVDNKVTQFRLEHKSEVIEKFKELMKMPVMNDNFSDYKAGHRTHDEQEEQLTVKKVVIKRLNDATGLDFNGKISTKDLNRVSPKIAEVMSQLYYHTHHPIDKLFQAVADADGHAETNFRRSFYPPSSRYGDEEQQIIPVIENFVQFTKDIYGTDDLKELLKSKWAFRGRINNTTEILKEKLWFYVTPGAEIPRSLGRSNRNEYKDGAEFLKEKLKDSYGDNMVIFDRYHEGTKKLDRWYIEPDGSLRADGNDGTAEVVSPPLPARDAMAALKTFYSKAAEMKLYTNGSTGLHINVSIPDKLDVLKLALFVGDQHVLKTFGRENNNYARSILGNLKDQRNIDTSSMKAAQKELSTLAKNLSGDHFATVNFNGKYVSFRHAGGDYLSRLDDITNTVGRFIFAMIIASDPAMYREEYLKKVTAMVGGYKKDEPQTGLSIRTNGIPSVNIDFVLMPNEMGDTDASLASVNQWLQNNISLPSIMVPDNDVAERMLNSTNGLASTTRDIITNHGNSVCARRPKVAVGVLWPGILKPGEKAFTQAYRGLISSGGARKKTKSLPLPEQQQ